MSKFFAKVFQRKSKPSQQVNGETGATHDVQPTAFKNLDARVVNVGERKCEVTNRHSNSSSDGSTSKIENGRLVSGAATDSDKQRPMGHSKRKPGQNATKSFETVTVGQKKKSKDARWAMKREAASVLL